MNAPVDHDFTSITPNPFIVGNPVRDPSMFFGRRTEFEEVKKRFADSERGGLLIFCGERRSGKTSILFQILQGRLGPDFIPVLVDMQSMAIDGEADFLEKIAREMHRAVQPDIPLPDFRRASRPSAVFLEFVGAVLREAPDRKLILLVDEYELLEDKIDTGVLSDDTLHVLSHLMENHAVFMVFTGSEHLEERRKEYWKILGRALHKRISYLSYPDAYELMTRPVLDRVEYDEAVLEGIFRLTAGQPFYTQGVCLYLVDALNEERTRLANEAVLGKVVERIVENPFPQMLFLWDGFERDEKFVLALLAETLKHDNDMADAKRVLQHLRSKKYPSPLGYAEIAATLEQLFKKEFLLKSQDDTGRFSFRMDLWRLWVRRMHSVWQVVRELGLRLRPVRPWWRRTIIPLASAAVLAVATVLLVVSWPDGDKNGSSGVGVGGGGGEDSFVTTMLDVRVVDPADAAVHVDGEFAGESPYRGSVDALRSHEIRITAEEGYADTTFTVAAGSGESVKHVLSLRPLRAELTVESIPAGAQLRLDGVDHGSTPVFLPSLLVPRMHRLELRLAGYDPHTDELKLEVGSNSRRYELRQTTTNVLLSTTPSGAMLSVDDGEARASPGTWRLALGRHWVEASHPGYENFRKEFTVTNDTPGLHFELVEEAKGAINIQGSELAAIWIGDDRVTSEGRGTGDLEYSRGTYQIRVDVKGKEEPIEQSIVVNPAELVIFNYSERSTSRRPYKGD